METVWFLLIALMVAGYAVMDGYDLGVGILSPLIARNEAEQAALRATIGHVWGANEVWLIALGGLLFLAFPRAYAASFSGFYLAFMILLWCLIGRGLALEVRSRLADAVWRTACDILFPLASFLVALALGTAAGNVIRGVPLDAQGRMFLPLWTNLSLGGGPAIFDWYTLVVGFSAVAIFSLHGANYLVAKTDGSMQQRARQLAARAWWPAAVLVVLSLAAAPGVNPALLENYEAHPAAFLVVGLPLAALTATFLLRRSEREAAAFMASAVLIIGLVASAALGLYPDLLPATSNPGRSLTVHNAAADPYGLGVALVWFGIGLCLMVLYIVFTHRLFGGKVRPGRDRY